MLSMVEQIDAIDKLEHELEIPWVGNVAPHCFEGRDHFVGVHVGFSYFDFRKHVDGMQFNADFSLEEDIHLTIKTLIDDCRKCISEPERKGNELFARRLLALRWLCFQLLSLRIFSFHPQSRLTLPLGIEQPIHCMFSNDPYPYQTYNSCLDGVNDGFSDTPKKTSYLAFLKELLSLFEFNDNAAFAMTFDNRAAEASVNYGSLWITDDENRDRSMSAPRDDDYVRGNSDDLAISKLQLEAFKRVAAVNGNITVWGDHLYQCVKACAGDLGEIFDSPNLLKKFCSVKGWPNFYDYVYARQGDGHQMWPFEKNTFSQIDNEVLDELSRVQSEVFWDLVMAIVSSDVLMNDFLRFDGASRYYGFGVNKPPIG